MVKLLFKAAFLFALLFIAVITTTQLLARTIDSDPYLTYHQLPSGKITAGVMDERRFINVSVDNWCIERTVRSSSDVQMTCIKTGNDNNLFYTISGTNYKKSYYLRMNMYRGKVLGFWPIETFAEVHSTNVLYAES